MSSSGAGEAASGGGQGQNAGQKARQKRARRNCNDWISGMWARWMRPAIDMERVLAPTHLALPTHLAPGEVKFQTPPFVPPRWIDETVRIVLDNFTKSDDVCGALRVPPMALARCSRGGKTRALLEIGQALRTAGIVVIDVSFADYSDVEQWEQEDPLGALCRRIAFAGLQGRNMLHSRAEWLDYKNTSVTGKQIRQWIGAQPCVLLIDELDALDGLQVAGATASLSRGIEELVEFVQEVFIAPAGRYCVFTSHVVATAQLLERYMEPTHSGRDVIVRGLPIIESVQTAREAFNWPELSVRQALYYGLVPSLIFEARKSELRPGIDIPTADRRNAIALCIECSLVNDSNLSLLLDTFVTGNPALVPQPLLPLMSVAEGGKVHWIPFHMAAALREFADQTGVRDKPLLNAIVRNFNELAAPPPVGRPAKAWETLFIATLLIRIGARNFLAADRSPLDLLPIDGSAFDKATVSIFQPVDHKNSVDDLVKGISLPSLFPYIYVYLPAHPELEHYDVVVAAYQRNGSRDLYGYQLTERDHAHNNSILAHSKRVMSFTKSFIIRSPGKVAPLDQKATHGWEVATEQQVDSFFGESGRHWTPTHWRSLARLVAEQ